MIIFKVHTIDGILTYTYEGRDNTEEADRGIIVFINAMKKQFENHPCYTFMTVMNDDGEYYNPTSNVYREPNNFEEACIQLSKIGKDES